MFVLKKDFCYSLSTLKLNGLQAEKFNRGKDCFFIFSVEFSAQR